MTNEKTGNYIKLSENDIKVLELREITVEKINRQINLIKRGTNFIELVRPCTVNDGLLQIDEANNNHLLELHQNALANGRFAKFVPASGAASRMFRKLEAVLNTYNSVTLDELKKNADSKQAEAYAVRFLENLNNFAFYQELKNGLESQNYDVDKLLEGGNVLIIINYLINPEGMNYTNKSKALLKFHKYPDENRTAFEEHVKEGIQYAGSNDRVILYFTVPPGQIEDFEVLAEKMKEKYSDFNLEIIFSFQKKSTDTIALNNEDELFRDNGEILFRPGGHGALLQNLNDLDEDLVYIKNVDNVQREENIETTILYKKLIAGLLIEKQSKIFELLELLENSDIDNAVIKESEEFLKDELMIEIREDYEQYSLQKKREYLFSLLNRPIRVCGMVWNEKEPGGGPFWIKDNDGSISKQIIESAQVNDEDSNQGELFESSTHFNPVDLIIGLRDYKGKTFDLNEYVNNDAVFVANKSKNGHALKSLELPGLWNGSMHHWISIFVEVPKSTFTPVKDVNDLLRKAHSC